MTNGESLMTSSWLTFWLTQTHVLTKDMTWKSWFSTEFTCFWHEHFNIFLSSKESIFPGLNNAELGQLLTRTFQIVSVGSIFSPNCWVWVWLSLKLSIIYKHQNLGIITVMDYIQSGYLPKLTNFASTKYHIPTLVSCS